jgi:hypothetical protein
MSYSVFILRKFISLSVRNIPVYTFLPVILTHSCLYVSLFLSFFSFWHICVCMFECVFRSVFIFVSFSLFICFSLCPSFLLSFSLFLGLVTILPSIFVFTYVSICIYEFSVVYFQCLFICHFFLNVS